MLTDWGSGIMTSNSCVIMNSAPNKPGVSREQYREFAKAGLFTEDLDGLMAYMHVRFKVGPGASEHWSSKRSGNCRNAVELVTS